MHIRPIFDFIDAALRAGHACALVTVTGVTGASTRNPGTHMAVADDGSFIGSLSGGCIEAAVVAEARLAMTEGVPREVSFGAGSHYIDIRLPCGGRIDLLINPIRVAELAQRILTVVGARIPFTLELPLLGDRQPRITADENKDRLSISAESICVGHVPDLRLVILGHGASVTALARLSHATGVDTLVVSPDALNLSQATELGVATCALKTPTDTPPNYDAWTAAAFLFHDHEWETAQIAAVLASPAFFVGAMGSYKTHDARLAALGTAGVPQDQLDRVVAPIGVIPSSRDPETLALSTLTQIVAAYHAHIARPF